MVAQRMVSLEPENVEWWQSWARCVRYWQSPAEAKTVLLLAARLFPEDGLVFFNLGCLAAVQGRILDAQILIKKACLMNAKLKLLALTCEDLESVWNHVTRD